MSLSDDDIRLILDAIVLRKKKVKYVAERYRISGSRVYQLLDEYKKNGYYPRSKKRGPKPQKVSESIRHQIIAAKEKTKGGSACVTKFLRNKRDRHLGNMTVHQVLLEEGLTDRDPSKSNRRKPEQ